MRYVQDDSDETYLSHQNNLMFKSAWYMLTVLITFNPW
jgi:hypothetical protein